MKRYDSYINNNRSTKISKEKIINNFSSRDNKNKYFESRSIRDLPRNNQDIKDTALSNSIILSVISNILDNNKDEKNNACFKKLKGKTSSKIKNLSLIKNISEGYSSRSLKKFNNKHYISNIHNNSLNSHSPSLKSMKKNIIVQKSLELKNTKELIEKKNNQENVYNNNQNKVVSFGKKIGRRRSVSICRGKNNKFKETVIGFDKKVLEELPIRNKKTTKPIRRNHIFPNININNNNEWKRRSVNINYKMHKGSSNSLIALTNEQEDTKTNNELMAIIAFRKIHKQLKNNIGDNIKSKLYKYENNDITDAINKLPPIKPNENNNNNDIINNNNENNKNINDNEIKKKSDKNLNFSNSKVSNKQLIYKKSSKNIDKKLKNDKYRILSLRKKVYDSLDDDDIVEEIVDNLYFKPDSVFLFIFDTLIMISSFIVLVYLPLYLAKNIIFCRSFLNFNNNLFYIIDFIYILDLILGFYRAYYNFDELLVRNSKEICKNYLSSWFFYDLIASIPIFSFIKFFQNDCEDELEIFHSQYYNINLHNFHFLLVFFKVIKTFKVFNSNISLEKLSNALQENELISNWGNVFLFLFFFVSSINFSACLFIFVGRNTYQSWIINNRFENLNFWHIYIAAIYYIIMTITTVGYGDLVGKSLIELIFQTVILFVGTCIYSWLISATSSYIKKMTDIHAHYENKIKILDEIKLTNPNLTNDLYDKIIRLLNYRKYYKEIDKNVIIESLPYTFRNSLIIEIYKPFINNFIFFKNIRSQDFIVQVVSKLKPALSVKGDILVQEGDFIEDIIFVKDGLLSLEMKIDIDYPDKTIQDYLSKNSLIPVTINKTKKNKSNQQTSSLHRDSEIKSQYLIKSKLYEASGDYNILSKNRSILMAEKFENISYVKIDYIRKNEHFGDVYMFLNNRSPLFVKAKSKKVELLLLKKLDAVSISTTYPKIWKKIIAKSLIITKKLRYLTLKMLLIFCNFHGIKIKFFGQKKFNIFDIKNFIPNQLYNINILKKKTFPLNNEILQNIDGIEGLENNDKKKKRKRKISTVIYEEQDEETSNESMKDSPSKNKNKTKNNLSKNNSKIEKRKIKSIKTVNNKKKKVNFTKEPVIKLNETIINSNKRKSHIIISKITNKSDDGNIISSSESESSLKNNNNIPKNNKTYKSSKIINNSIESPIINNNFEKEIDNNNSLEDNYIDEVNDEIYPGEIFNIEMPNYNNKIINVKNEININNNIINTPKNDNKPFCSEKIYIKNVNIFDNNYLEHIFQKHKENLNEKNNNKSKSEEKKFNSLEISSESTMEINSSYENINKLTNYSYISDDDLRKKTKNFLLEKCGIQANAGKKVNFVPKRILKKAKSISPNILSSFFDNNYQTERSKLTERMKKNKVRRSFQSSIQLDKSFRTEKNRRFGITTIKQSNFLKKLKSLYYDKDTNNLDNKFYKSNIGKKVTNKSILKKKK